MLENPYYHNEDAKEERAGIRAHVWVWLVRVGVLLAILVGVAVVTEAYAEELKPAPVYVAQIGANKLYLFQDACALGGWFATWKRAQWFYRGTNFDACWKIHRDDDGLYVKTVDSGGDAGSIPLPLFRKDEGA